MGAHFCLWGGGHPPPPHPHFGTPQGFLGWENWQCVTPPPPPHSCWDPSPSPPPFEAISAYGGGGNFGVTAALDYFLFGGGRCHVAMGGGVSMSPLPPSPSSPPLSPPHNVAIAMATPAVRSCRVTTARGHRPRGDTDTGGGGATSGGSSGGGGCAAIFTRENSGGGTAGVGRGGMRGKGGVNGATRGILGG